MKFKYDYWGTIYLTQHNYFFDIKSDKTTLTYNI